MARDFIVQNINDVTSSYGTNNIPMSKGIPGPISINKDIPYRVVINTADN